MSNLLDKASILLTPTAYNDGSMLSVKPENGDGDFTFSRGGNGSRVNSSGNIVTESANIPRIDYTDGCGNWLLEPQSTNLYLNSDTLATQSNTTSASTYTVSFYGTGTITFSGTHTGTLVGTGANDRVSATFTATAGTLTSTISGTCEKGQLENLSYASSYIPTNGATSTRLADEATNSGNSTLINSTEGVLYVEIAAFNDTSSLKLLALQSNDNSNRISIGYSNVANTFRVIIRVNGSNVVNQNLTASNLTDFNKIAFKYKSGQSSIYFNGSEILDLSSTNFTFSQDLSILGFNGGSGGNPFYGKAKALAVYKEALTDAQLQSLTTQ